MTGKYNTYSHYKKQYTDPTKKKNNQPNKQKMY